ncbi:MAG: dimethylmenaquinone methyltransferase [Rhodobacteraceae bacterium CG17_big_fil_post_rev_8_21_14_2_50_63_15]|nr:TraR/DksA family transcriptional regulator [Roseovarius sp.]PIV79231.1 MAG: dimethylmenaquinone methyltransferase [Rhodobacteraceae bacterium CG17_big_fil_post_rev_8_21_14_2_50_63_15]
MRDTTKYRDVLMARLADLDKRLHRIESELGGEKAPDFSDAAIDREGEEVLERLGQGGQEEVARIRAALGRIREGSYGICVQCGEQISAERLDILPETPLCRHCAAHSA